MEIRRLGRSGLFVSAVSYGNWITHGSQVSEETAHACVRTALDLGISTFDTADVYGGEGVKAEDVLGRALQGVRRESVEILTKVYWRNGDAPNDVGLSRKHIMESIDASLRRLRTDHVDVYQAHRFDRYTPIEETMSAFADVVHSGKAHYIGVSEWRGDAIRDAHALAKEYRIPLISSQPQYSMLWRVPEAEVLPVCAELGISQIVWSPMAQGVLTGKYLPGRHVAGSRVDETGGGSMARFMKEDILTRVQRLRPLADQAGLTMAQLAVAWVLQNPNVASAIVGASRPDQLPETVAAAGVTLDADLLKAIDEVIDPVAERDPELTLIDRGWPLPED